MFDIAALWVEHDPMEIIETVKVCMANAVDKATADGHNVGAGLKAIGITNQRETTVMWSKSTGLPQTRTQVIKRPRRSTLQEAASRRWAAERSAQ
ncbi:hypothetical protein EJB05_39914, partial [Eragrostis curvula]